MPDKKPRIFKDFYPDAPIYVPPNLKSALKTADRNFWNTFDKLAVGQEEMVFATLDTSFAERDSLYSLWGLLVNAGYLTVTEWVDAERCVVKIPNGEVLSEFQTLISELAGVVLL